MKTELKDRTLWFDGTSQVSPELVPQLLLLGVNPKQIVVDGTNEDIEQFNIMADEPLEFGKLKNSPFDMSWKIPVEYRQMDLDSVLAAKFDSFLTSKNLNRDDRKKYEDRIKVELQEIKLRGMETLIKVLIYVIDRLRETETVWGVGRGSSCASLVLYLIGLHKVDPIKYGISHTEFFHD